MLVTVKRAPRKGCFGFWWWFWLFCRCWDVLEEYDWVMKWLGQNEQMMNCHGGKFCTSRELMWWPEWLDAHDIGHRIYICKLNTIKLNTIKLEKLGDVGTGQWNCSSCREAHRNWNFSHKWSVYNGSECKVAWILFWCLHDLMSKELQSWKEYGVGEERKFHGYHVNLWKSDMRCSKSRTWVMKTTQDAKLYPWFWWMMLLITTVQKASNHHANLPLEMT